MKSKKVIIISSITIALFTVIMAVSIFLNFRFTHKITYKLYGGKNANNATTVWEGDSVTLKTPTKYGYVFTGWENKYGEKVEKLENVKNDITLYASWELDPEFYGELPVIDINTRYGELPDNKKDYVPATFNMYNCADETHNLEGKSIGIRLRGNSTMQYVKKPYRIKFDKKTSLLGLEKNKSWVLLADWLDQSSIRNYTAFSIASEMDNLSYGNSANHVIVTINGEYQGLYLLTEQVDEKEGRTGASIDALGEEVEISVTDTSFPFLVEMDRSALGEGVRGVDNFETPFYPCEIKYPELDERNIPEGEEDVVYNYIKEYVCAAFSSLKTGQKVDVSFSDEPMGFEDLVDVDSFMEFWLVNQVMHNTDSYWGSVYMSKTQTGKLTFGPVWDFDWSMTTNWTGKPYRDTEINLATSPFLLTNGSMLDYFIKNQNNYNLLCDKWNSVKGNVLSVYDNMIIYKDKVVKHAIQDGEFWYKNHIHASTIYSKYIVSPAVQVETQYNYVLQFLSKRIDYLTQTLVYENYDTIAK